jgi:glycosyltransferase involved in cell wall biosynthesis
MGSQPRVEVLLATHNGQQFVREQIDSLLGQDYANLTVLARDDESTDGTQDVLKEYALRFPDRFRVLELAGGNGGILNNFLSLMKASTADYVCFSDQDDVWLPNKVNRTKRMMDDMERKWGAHTPLLVFTDLRVVDQNLDTLYPSFWGHMGIDPEWANNLGKLLANPTVTGCTTLINHKMAELATRMPLEGALHDRWIGFLASAMGKTAFLRDQTVLYRQHGSNAVGIGANQRSTSLPRGFRRVRFSVGSYIERWQSCQKEAAIFLEAYQPALPLKQRKVFAAFRRCDTSDSSIVRMVTFLRHRFYFRGCLAKVVMLFYLGSRIRKGQQPSHSGFNV